MCRKTDQRLSVCVFSHHQHETALSVCVPHHQHRSSSDSGSYTRTSRVCSAPASILDVNRYGLDSRSVDLLVVVSPPSAAVLLLLGNPTRACWPARKFSTSTQSTALLSTASCVGPDLVDGGGLLERALASMLVPPPTSNSPRFGPRLRDLHEDARLRTRIRAEGFQRRAELALPLA